MGSQAGHSCVMGRACPSPGGRGGVWMMPPTRCFSLRHSVETGRQPHVVPMALVHRNSKDATGMDTSASMLTDSRR